MDTKVNKAVGKTQETVQKVQQEGGKLLDSIAAELKGKAESVADQIFSVGKTVIDRAQEAVGKTQEAVEKAQHEGSKILESIAKEGEKVKAQTQNLAEKRLEEAKGKLGEVKDKAADTWDNLEKIFEDRVSHVLMRLGIPTRDDLQTIAKRLEDLNQSIKELVKVQGVPKALASRPTEQDNLQAITGVGPALKSKLNANGIFTYRQIAMLQPEDIERIETKVIHSSGRINRDNWINQAKELHFKKYNERL